MTCRRCGGVGYKGQECKSRRRTTEEEDIQKSPEEAQPYKPQQTKPKIGARKCKQNPKPKRNIIQPPPPVRQAVPTTEERKDSREEPKHLYISMAIDFDVLEGIERMKRFSIISVTEKRGGMVLVSDIKDVLSCLIDEQWNWEVKELRDGRFITPFPTAELARQTEAEGPLKMLSFTLNFEPWTPDLWKKDRADGAIRWVIVKQLPMDCWSRDLVARLLKPTGDLVYMDGRSGEYGDDLRLLLRIRRPRRLPANIHCSIGTRQYEYVLEMERGQPALPWGDLQRTRKGDKVALVNDTGGPQVGESKQHQLDNRKDKGKAPMVEVDEAQTRRSERWPTGIILRERRPSLAWNPSPSPAQPSDRRTALETGKLNISQMVADDGTRATDETRSAAMGLIADSRSNHVDHDMWMEAAALEQRGADLGESNRADVDLYMQVAWRSKRRCKETLGSIETHEETGLMSLVQQSTNPTKCLALTSQGIEVGGPHTNIPEACEGGLHLREGQTLGRAQDLVTTSPKENGPLNNSVSDPLLLAQPREIQSPARIEAQPILTTEHHWAEEDQMAAIVEPMNSTVMANANVQANSPMKSSNYIKAHFNPNDTNIKTLTNGIMIDLSQTTLRKIGNSWNLLTEEAWEIINKGNTLNTTTSFKPPKQTTTSPNPRKDLIYPAPTNPQEEQPPMPRKRGRPKKVNQQETYMTLEEQRKNH
ncbi:hypothetical protein J5N97_000815 [Dioscorea zingiberensis]|uniref:DUF4283 domain-containing protein n=1 Tax=Dioscorea zingiberensis TaxID=325984 RepID=A0A9D5BV34_9LILI|nr:hypothetical protein J5N97_000815 [Dioscorea zingiberensis]